MASRISPSLENQIRTLAKKISAGDDGAALELYEHLKDENVSFKEAAKLLSIDETKAIQDAALSAISAQLVFLLDAKPSPSTASISELFRIDVKEPAAFFSITEADITRKTGAILGVPLTEDGLRYKLLVKQVDEIKVLKIAGEKEQLISPLSMAKTASFMRMALGEMSMLSLSPQETEDFLAYKQSLEPVFDEMKERVMNELKNRILSLDNVRSNGHIYVLGDILSNAFVAYGDEDERFVQARKAIKSNPNAIKVTLSDVINSLSRIDMPHSHAMLTFTALYPEAKGKTSDEMMVMAHAELNKVARNTDRGKH